MRHLKTLLAVLGATTVLVLAANTVAIAANGHGFLLGQNNSASKITTLTRTTSGTALQVKTKSSSNAPFAVNGSGKVTHLNADLLDGYNSSALRPASYSWTRSITVATGSTTLPLVLPPGTYIIGYDAYMQSGAAPGGSAGCYFYTTDPILSNRFYGESYNSPAASGSVGASGTSIVTIVSGDSLDLYCHASANFTTNAHEPIHVYATRTNVVGGGNLRSAAPRSHVRH